MIFIERGQGVSTEAAMAAAMLNFESGCVRYVPGERGVDELPPPYEPLLFDVAGYRCTMTECRGFGLVYVSPFDAEAVERLLSSVMSIMGAHTLHLRGGEEALRMHSHSLAGTLHGMNEKTVRKSSKVIPWEDEYRHVASSGGGERGAFVYKNERPPSMQNGEKHFAHSRVHVNDYFTSFGFSFRWFACSLGTYYKAQERGWCMAGPGRKDFTDSVMETIYYSLGIDLLIDIPRDAKPLIDIHRLPTIVYKTTAHLVETANGTFATFSSRALCDVEQMKRALRMIPRLEDRLGSRLGRVRYCCSCRCALFGVCFVIVKCKGELAFAVMCAGCFTSGSVDFPWWMTKSAAYFFGKWDFGRGNVESQRLKVTAERYDEEDPENSLWELGGNALLVWGKLPKNIVLLDSPLLRSKPLLVAAKQIVIWRLEAAPPGPA